jgi:hypothetical protein
LAEDGFNRRKGGKLLLHRSTAKLDFVDSSMPGGQTGDAAVQTDR